jgi:hypothetical protein
VRGSKQPGERPPATTATAGGTLVAHCMPWSQSDGTVTCLRLLLGLNVVHCLVEFAPELLDTVVDAVQVCAKADHQSGSRRGFLDLGVIHAAEPQLLSMERGSIRAVDGGRCPEGNEGLITRTQFTVV